MIWFWFGGALAAWGLTVWTRWLVGRPGAPGWLAWVAGLPGLAWGICVLLAGWYSYRSFLDLDAVEASLRAEILAQNVTRAMIATAIGAGLLLLLAAVLGGLTWWLRRSHPSGPDDAS